MRLSARVRLTLSYLAVIMAISLSFSAALYKSSTEEAVFRVSQQNTSLRSNAQVPLNLYGVIDRISSDSLDNFKRGATKQLIIINLVMLVAGSVVSYRLAKRSLQPLERALEMQARFTSDAAHELRTPLTAMKSEIEVGLRQKNLKSSEAKTLLNSNLEEVTKLENLTSTLLELYQKGADDENSMLRPVKITELVDEALKRLKPLAEIKKIKLETEIDRGLRVNGEKDQLSRLIVILLDNAIKYSPKNGEVLIRGSNTDHGVKLSVTDKGVGIKEADLPHVFERFYRSDHSRAQSGYGLGLSLAKLIANKHGASISVKSQLGRGSTFTVSFPNQTRK